MCLCRTDKGEIGIQDNIYPGTISGLGALVAVLDIYQVVKAAAEAGNGNIDRHERALRKGQDGEINGIGIDQLICLHGLS